MAHLYVGAVAGRPPRAVRRPAEDVIVIELVVEQQGVQSGEALAICAREAVPKCARLRRHTFFRERAR